MKGLINNGNLTGFGCSLFFIAGLAVVYLSVEYASNYLAKIVGFSIGMALMAIGGYAAKAAALRLHPFGKSQWRIAKETYKDSTEKASDKNMLDSNEQ
jgi:hypothetical protein